jgi:hypothetical protein
VCKMMKGRYLLALKKRWITAGGSVAVEEFINF